MPNPPQPMAYPLRRSGWVEIPGRREAIVMELETTTGERFHLLVTPEQLRALAANFLERATILDGGKRHS